MKYPWRGAELIANVVLFLLQDVVCFCIYYSGQLYFALVATSCRTMLSDSGHGMEQTLACGLMQFKIEVISFPSHRCPGRHINQQSTLPFTSFNIGLISVDYNLCYLESTSPRG